MLIHCIIPFVSTLISALSLKISCFLILLGVLAPFCSKGYRCSVQLLVYTHPSFFLEVLRALCFHPSTAFIVSHKFGCVVPSFPLNTRKSFISFLISYLTKVSLSRAWFSFHVYVGILLFFLLLKNTITSHCDLLGVMGYI